MAIEILSSGSSFDAATNTATIDISRFGGVYLYVNYVPGAEAGCDLTFKVRDKKHPRVDDFFSILSDGAEYSISLATSPAKQLVPVPVPESADKMEIVFTATGGSFDGSEVLEVYANGDGSFA